MKKTEPKKTQKSSLFKSFIDRIFYPTAAFYTLINMFFYLCGTFFDLSDRHMVLTRSSAFLILLFSFFVVLANLVLTEKKLKLHISLRILIHYLVCTLCFFLLFIKIAEYDAGTSSTIIILIVFTVVYFLICGTVLGIKGALTKSRNDCSEYKSIYGD